jgi:hypothetical protein
MDITYYHRPSLLTTPERQASHKRICAPLNQLQPKYTSSVIDADQEFPTADSQTAFIEQIKLRDFAVRRHVKLRQEFGSRKHSFCWLPTQFILVHDSDTLVEVFPCRMGDDRFEPLHFLERTIAGEPWTNHSSNGMQGTKHKLIIDAIKTNPAVLESE